MLFVIGLDWQTESWERYTGIGVGKYFTKYIQERKLDRARKSAVIQRKVKKTSITRDTDYGKYATQPPLVGQELELECKRILASLQVTIIFFYFITVRSFVQNIFTTDK